MSGMTRGAVQNPPTETVKRRFAVEDYDLAATLTSGQAFRWSLSGGAWVGVIGPRWVRLESDRSGITAEVAGPVADWSWLTDYLQCDQPLSPVLQSFPTDAPMRAAVSSCRGLRLLRQDPWECLASFILSSTKQITQIRQNIALVCRAFGQSVVIPQGHEPVYGFPCPTDLANATEAQLRSCKMGFRAPYLLAAARKVASGELDLNQLRKEPITAAREKLVRIPGVGRKIADCVLLFAYGFQSAFPIDVWVMRALKELYFPRAKVNLKRLQEFSGKHFGPNAGYAQQYLFHYMRTQSNSHRRLIRTTAETEGTSGSID